MKSASLTSAGWAGWREMAQLAGGFHRRSWRWPSPVLAGSIRSWPVRCLRLHLPIAAQPAATDDDGMADVPGDERCKHGEIAAWCGESECVAARKGLPVRVCELHTAARTTASRLAKRCSRDTAWLSVTATRPTPRSLSRCRLPCPLGSANASTAFPRTSLRKRSHARCCRTGMGRRIPAGMAARNRWPVERSRELPARGRPSRRSQRSSRAQASRGLKAPMAVRCSMAASLARATVSSSGRTARIQAAVFLARNRMHVRLQITASSDTG